MDAICKHERNQTGVFRDIECGITQQGRANHERPHDWSQQIVPRPHSYGFKCIDLISKLPATDITRDRRATTCRDQDAGENRNKDPIRSEP